jgi:fimbrial isopeptide formation D2 family protein
MYWNVDPLFTNVALYRLNTSSGSGYENNLNGYGHLIAPNSDVTIRLGNYDGGVIAKNVNLLNGELHFVPTDPEQPLIPDVPEEQQTSYGKVVLTKLGNTGDTELSTIANEGQKDDSLKTGKALLDGITFTAYHVESRYEAIMQIYKDEYAGTLAGSIILEHKKFSITDAFAQIAQEIKDGKLPLIDYVKVIFPPTTSGVSRATLPETYQGKNSVYAIVETDVGTGNPENVLEMEEPLVFGYPISESNKTNGEIYLYPKDYKYLPEKVLTSGQSSVVEGNIVTYDLKFRIPLDIGNMITTSTKKYTSLIVTDTPGTGLTFNKFLSLKAPGVTLFENSSGLTGELTKNDLKVTFSGDTATFDLATATSFNALKLFAGQELILSVQGTINSSAKTQVKNVMTYQVGSYIKSDDVDVPVTSDDYQETGFLPSTGAKSLGIILLSIAAILSIVFAWLKREKDGKKDAQLGSNDFM